MNSFNQSRGLSAPSLGWVGVITAPTRPIRPPVLTGLSWSRVCFGGGSRGQAVGRGTSNAQRLTSNVQCTSLNLLSGSKGLRTCAGISLWVSRSTPTGRTPSTRWKLLCCTRSLWSSKRMGRGSGSNFANLRKFANERSSGADGGVCRMARPAAVIARGRTDALAARPYLGGFTR